VVTDFASSNALNDKDSKNQAGQQISTWFQTLKDTGGFGPVPDKILQDGRCIFESDRISDQQTLETIKSYYKQVGYILDPHSAVGVTAAKRSIDRTSSHMSYISMSTAHPAKFSQAVKLALKDEHGFEFEKSVLPPELARLAQMEKRVITVENSWETVREIIKRQISKDRRNKSSN
jgi:threonine synthase